MHKHITLDLLIFSWYCFLGITMDRLRQAADQTKVVVKMPPKWLGMYSDFITKNAGAVGQVEGAIRSLTYIIPGELCVSMGRWPSIDNSQAASENPNSPPNRSTPASNSSPSTMTPSSHAHWRSRYNDASTNSRHTTGIRASTTRKAARTGEQQLRCRSYSTPSYYWR